MFSITVPIVEFYYTFQKIFVTPFKNIRIFIIGIEMKELLREKTFHQIFQKMKFSQCIHLENFPCFTKSKTPLGHFNASHS